jgi:hypothetical protein
MVKFYINRILYVELGGDSCLENRRTKFYINFFLYVELGGAAFQGNRWVKFYITDSLEYV